MKTEMRAELVAPCGINCRLCYSYIRKKNPCSGCRAADSEKLNHCTKCKIALCEKRLQNSWETCAPCDNHCRRIKDLNKRYRDKYHVNMLENLAIIQSLGMQAFLQKQAKSFLCSTCGEILCVHREYCPSCEALAW